MSRITSLQEESRGVSDDLGPGIHLTLDVVCYPLSIVNIYFVGPPHAGDRHYVLVDAGLAISGPSIRRTAEALFDPGSRPSAIILTHGHFDHVGALPELADRWDVPIYAHPLELPYLTGRSAYPPPDPAVGGGAMSFLSRFFPRGPLDLGDRVRPLPADGSVPGLPGWRWVHTPGHTPGHVALFRDEDRTLIAGDAFTTVAQESFWAVLTQTRRVHRPPAYYTIDWPAARRSVAALAALEPRIAGTGHGVPMGGDELRRQLDELLRLWEEEALPSHGRYVERPAIADERGVVEVPPPVTDRQLLLVAGLGAAALVGWLLWRGRK